MDDKIGKKLDDIHEDVKDIKGEFKTVHHRMDREASERHWTIVGILQSIKELEQRIIEWFRK